MRTAPSRSDMRFAMLALALALVAAGTACDGSGTSGGQTGSAQLNLEPFTGTLTAERIRGAKGIVKPLEGWDRAYAQLEAQMGKPTRVREDGYHEWAVVEGDACTYIQVEKATEDAYLQGGEGKPVVGLFIDPITVEKRSTPIDFLECTSITGALVGPPEDPGAAGPPSDGAPIDLRTFLEAAIKGRSKWKGQRVKVKGVLGAVSTATLLSGTTTIESHSATIIGSASERKPEVTCALRAGEGKPEATADAPVVAEGRVVVRELIDGRGEAKLEAALEDCVLDLSAAKSP